MQVSGVTSGALFDPPSGSIRQVLGVPGGARFGSPIVSGLDNAWISPDGKSAVTLAAGQVSGIRIQADGGYSTTPWGPAPDKFKAVWSRDGKAAVGIYPQEDGTAAFQVWRVEQSSVDGPIPITLVYASIRSLAVRARTSEIFAAVQDANAGGLYSVAFSGNSSQLNSQIGLEALALDTVDTLLYGFTSTGNTLLTFNTATDSLPVAMPAQVSTEVTCPCSLAPSTDGGHLALAYAATDQLLVYETATANPPAVILLEGRPEGLDAYGSAGLFTLALRRQDAASALLLDVKSGSVYFVPASPPAN